MIGNNLDTPIVYQDLATSSMGPMNIGFMGGSPSYLGGIKMKRQLDADKIEIKNKKKQQDKKAFKIALMALGAIVGLSLMPSLFKKCKKMFGISPQTSKSKFSWTSIKNGLYNVTVKPLKAVGKGIKNLFGKFKKKP